MALKIIAWLLTDSVGLFSDALESLVNLAGGLMMFAMLTVAARPADESHTFGHSKAEYFSSILEGILIIVAAAAIAAAAVPRIVEPRHLHELGVGIAVSAAAALINLIAAYLLLRAGRKHRSIALEADARHLLTDVWTSAGVIAGVAAEAVTDWLMIDPIVALLVAAHITRSGFSITRRSVRGLMDGALPPYDRQKIEEVLGEFRQAGIEFHAIRTRQAGSQSFVSMHVLVPGEWSVKQGHALLEDIEGALRQAVPGLIVQTHLEVLGDPASLGDARVENI